MCVDLSVFSVPQQGPEEGLVSSYIPGSGALAVLR